MPGPSSRPPGQIGELLNLIPGPAPWGQNAHECAIARTMRIDLDETRLDRGKNKVPKAIYVASVGPALTVKGGVTRVIELIGVHLPEHICVRFIATFNRYTGYDG